MGTLSSSAPEIKSDSFAQLDLFADEPRLYHDPQQRGFFSILYEIPEYQEPVVNLFSSWGPEDFELVTHPAVKRQRTYPLAQMPARLAALDPSRDTWISQAEFFRPNRQIVNLARVGLAWVDCDTYHVPALRDLSAEQLTGQLLDYCNDNGFPLPSVVVFSGRGLQIKWLFTHALPAKALIRWNAVQKALLLQFAPFGADPLASDGSRVLRLVNTTNTKSGLTTRVMWPFSRNLDDVQLYGFDALAAEVLPVQRQVIEERRKRPAHAADDLAKRQAAAARADNRAPAEAGEQAFRGVAGYGVKRLWWYRLLDIRRLVQLRGGNGPATGTQDLCLWLSAIALSWSVSPTRLDREVEALAREFAPTWRPGQGRAVLLPTMQRAKDAAAGKLIEFEGRMVDPRYRISNAWIISKLKITDAEQRQMLTIISKDVARERDAAGWRQRHQAAGGISREAYLMNVEQKRVEARLRAARGESQKQIAEALEVNRTTVYRWLNPST